MNDRTESAQVMVESADAAVSLRRWWRERTYVTLALSFLMILGMGWLRPDKSKGVPTVKYQAMKMRWSGCADVVLTGDSRTYMGLSPAILSKHLPGRRIYNYSFSGNGYSRVYLSGIGGVFDPGSDSKMVVMGISPHSLTPDAIEMNEYIDRGRQSESDQFIDYHLGGLMSFLDTMSFRDALFGMIPSLKESHSDMTFYADGWVAGSREPESHKNQFRQYSHIFTNNQVSEAVVSDLLGAIRGWRESGIKVYGFRPPTTETMVEIEGRLSGFDQAGFVQAFEAAGGCWLDVDQTGYASYDGGHLRWDGAQALSEDLGRAIAAREKVAVRR